MRLKLSGGGLEKLRDFQRRFEGADRVMLVLSKNLAEQAVELVKEGFEKEQDPEGESWAPLKYRQGMILQDTGRLRNSWHTEDVDARGFTVAPGVDYAQYHQTGTSRGLPARPMVPTDGQLPDEWRRRFSEIATTVLKDQISGR